MGKSVDWYGKSDSKHTSLTDDDLFYIFASSPRSTYCHHTITWVLQLPHRESYFLYCGWPIKGAKNLSAVKCYSNKTAGLAIRCRIIWPQGKV